MEEVVHVWLALGLQLCQFLFHLTRIALQLLLLTLEALEVLEPRSLRVFLSSNQSS